MKYLDLGKLPGAIFGSPRVSTDDSTIGVEIDWLRVLLCRQNLHDKQDDAHCCLVNHVDPACLAKRFSCCLFGMTQLQSRSCFFTKSVQPILQGSSPTCLPTSALMKPDRRIPVNRRSTLSTSPIQTESGDIESNVFLAREDLGSFTLPKTSDSVGMSPSHLCVEFRQIARVAQPVCTFN